MKKVLLIVIGLVLVVGAVIGMRIYKASQSAERVTELQKFVNPSVEGWEAYLDNKKLKDPEEPAPLYELKVKGDDIIPDMAGIVKDTTKPDNVRCAAAIILAHTKKKAALEPLVEGLKEKEGQLGECISFMISLLPFESVPAKIAEMIDGASDPKVRRNGFRAIEYWVTEEAKRKMNDVPMQAVIKGLDEKDKETLLLLFKYMKRLQFRFERKDENTPSLGEQMAVKLLPLMAHEDEALAAAATAALEYQFSYMGDNQKVDMIQTVAPYSASDKPLFVRNNALRILAKLNRELAQNKATIVMCDLDSLLPFLESDDKEMLEITLDTLGKCGTERKHRVAVKDFEDRTTDEALKAKAKEAVELILKREEESE